jgi:peptidoglycan-associated lipoprotein
MPQWVIPRVLSAVLLCSIIVTPFIGCGKKVTSSTGEAASSSKGRSATGPVEKITPDTMATFPEEKSSSTTKDTAREPLEAAPPTSIAGGTESAPSSAAPSEGTLSLGDIFFDFDQHMIRRDAQATLSANAAWINGRPGKAVVIEGHCDERGTQAYNLVLGEKRARSAKRYLEDLGVPASRLKTTSYGELRPFCKERDENCYQQNRRAHFVTQ